MEIQITDNSKEVLAELFEKLDQALDYCGFVAAGYAKLDCPVDTGNLRSKIGHTTIVEKNDFSCYIGTNVEYAPYVEFGTYKMKARPFLRPAASNHKDEYTQIIEYMLKN